MAIKSLHDILCAPPAANLTLLRTRKLREHALFSTDTHQLASGVDARTNTAPETAR